jgi:phosphoglycolate phosphatase
MKSSYKHVVWDWNGTLLDDVQSCLTVLNQMLIQRQMSTINIQQYRERLDFPVMDFYRDIGFDFQKETYQSVANEYIAGYDHCWPRCPLHQGARDILQSLNAAGISQSVLSAYQQNRLEEAVDYFDLTCFFVKLIGLNDLYAAGKAANGKRWIQQLNHPTCEVLLIGDTVHDADVARQMGIDCVLTTFGHNSEQRLQNCGVRLFDSLTEIAAMLMD